MNMVEFLKKELNMNFEAAVKHVTDTVVSGGFAHLMSKSLSAVFKKTLNIDYAKYTMILACSPKIAKAALDVSFNMGMLFPCSFVVYEENEKVYVAHVSIMKIGPEIGLASIEEMQPVIKMTGEAVHKVWEQL
ncbi:MAG: DUF302 domain-containing protein [Candidatus Lokiarchaeota archaeon]|nr:DUF302 domain-containing protein [Candidatus Lokiarchaeota archaeon]